MILNETPLRTSKNFHVNDIEINNISIPESMPEFNSRSIYINSEKEVLVSDKYFENSEENVDLYEDSRILVSEIVKDDFRLKYGVGSELSSRCANNPNQQLRIVAKEGTQSNASVEFVFDENNNTLQDKIEIYAEKDSTINVIINYIPRIVSDEFSSLNIEAESDQTTLSTEDNSSYHHNGIIKAYGLENSEINITVINLLSNSSNNFLSVENKLLENAKLDFSIVDFGGENSITNYFCDLIGKFADNRLNTIYLGNNSQLFDMNYIAHCKGENTNVDIEVQGALKDSAIKHFKGTIDFKKGCKKSIGNENENCLLLSDTAKSLALPMLLCSEEDVEGNHSSSSGKASPSELFYLMTRGFSETEAMKLLVRAKFNKFLESINNNEIKNLINYFIDKKL
jgi:Fe-S cluster assembly scaffold protein SufB